MNSENTFAFISKSSREEYVQAEDEYSASLIYRFLAPTHLLLFRFPLARLPVSWQQASSSLACKEFCPYFDWFAYQVIIRKLSLERAGANQQPHNRQL